MNQQALATLVLAASGGRPKGGIGIIVVIVILAVVAFVLYKRRSRSRPGDDEPPAGSAPRDGTGTHPRGGQESSGPY